MRGRERAIERMEMWPKGCPEPKGYADWHEWSRAQYAHGLRQTQCPECQLWLFPQSEHGPNCSKGLPAHVTDSL